MPPKMAIFINMASIPKTQAQSEAEAAQAAIWAAANAKFIAEVDAQIQLAIAQGLYFVNCTTSEDVNPADLFTYYTNLGYQFQFPGYSKYSQPTAPPDELGNGFYVSAWLNTGLTRQKLEKPYRFLIIWK